MEPSVTNASNPDAHPITEEDIEQMIQELFESMLGLQVARVENRSEENFSGGLRGKINIDGAWEASLNVLVTKSLCDHLSCTMFGCDIDSLDQQDISDAIGEVANVIGGNVKGIVDQDCNLSIPEVETIDTNQNEFNPSTLWFECDGESLCVELSVN